MNAILSQLGIIIVGLDDFPQIGEIEETGSTLLENSLIKARTVHKITGLPALADDTGLEVDALDGAPGVFSARYSGPNCNSSENMALLLKNLANFSNKKARFRTVITYRDEMEIIQFEGIVNGIIIGKGRGNYGFGYDPIFIPDGSQLTFAEMPLEEKNKFSHRARAFEKLKSYLMDKLQA